MVPFFFFTEYHVKSIKSICKLYSLQMYDLYNDHIKMYQYASIYFTSLMAQHKMSPNSQWSLSLSVCALQTSSFQITLRWILDLDWHLRLSIYHITIYTKMSFLRFMYHIPTFKNCTVRKRSQTEAGVQTKKKKHRMKRNWCLVNETEDRM